MPGGLVIASHSLLLEGSQGFGRTLPTCPLGYPLLALRFLPPSATETQVREQGAPSEGL